MVTVDQDTNTGIVCPNCGSKKLLAVNTRRQLKSNVRLRSCKRCGQRIWTSETIISIVGRNENVTC